MCGGGSWPRNPLWPVSPSPRPDLRPVAAGLWPDKGVCRARCPTRRKDAQQRPLAGQSHSADPTVLPSHTANRPATTEAVTLATARAMAPPRSSWRVSYANVENVV